MKIEAARVAAYTAASAAISTLEPIPLIQWDNRTLIDMGNQTDPFVAVEFVLGQSRQMSLGETKVVRYWGQMAICVYIKEGGGIATATKVMDVLSLALGMKSFGGLNTHAAIPMRPALERGWSIHPLSVPFWFDDIVTS